ncbi:MAG: hypothetical protein JHC89_11345, partial [Acetobacteraceae bacterium]|nr:hypothetical protein [Acetobacteraceae bacterium]
MQPLKGLVFCFALLLALSPARHVLAQGGSILEAATVLGAPATMQPSIARFLTYNTPRAFAIGPDGASGWQSGGGD